jgi:tripartite-type tricarboxylate transporter receptor subunit TctC
MIACLIGFGIRFRRLREGPGSNALPGAAVPAAWQCAALRRFASAGRAVCPFAWLSPIVRKTIPGRKRMNARVVLLSGLVLSLVAAAGPATAQDWPTKPITIVSAQAGGGASDTIGRMVSERLQAALGQPVLIESRPGASGNVGAAAVARAAPDGYTLMIGTDAMMTSNVHLFKSMPFDPVKDFAPITNGGANIIVLAVHADLPVKSVAELVAHAKANPGKLQFGSSGVASPHHLAGELLKIKTGIDIVHVPYRGGSLSANDLVGGHIAVAFLSYSSAAPVLPTGKIRILGVVEKARYAAIPDVPTVAETVPGYEMTSWLGFFAPAGTPRPIVARLNAELVKILNVDTVKERLGSLGLSVAAGTPEALAETVRNGIAVRGDLIKAAKIEPQ